MYTSIKKYYINKHAIYYPKDSTGLQMMQASKLTKRYAKKHFDYVAHSFGQYEELTVTENIEFYARMYGVNDKEKPDELLQRYDLTKYHNH